MRRIIASFALSICALSAGALPKVAVLNPTLAKGIDEEVGSFIVDKILSQLIASRTFNILDRSSRDVIWKERNFQLTSGEVDSKQIKEIGKGLGADFIVVVKVVHIGTLFAMSAQMINVESLEVVSVASAEAPDKPENLVALATACGEQLASGGRATAPSGAVAAKGGKKGEAAAVTMPLVMTPEDVFDFAGRTTKIPGGGEWVLFDDTQSGGDSWAAIDQEILKNEGVVRLEYKLNPKYEYRTALLLADFRATRDLAKYSGIEIKLRGSGNEARIELVTDYMKDYAWYAYSFFKTPKEWTVLKIPFRKFAQPSWGRPAALDLKRITGIQLITASKRAGEKGFFEVAYLRFME